LLPLFLLFSCHSTSEAQLIHQVAKQYEQYKESSITHKRFKHAEIVPLIEKRQNDTRYRVIKAGKSVEERDIYLVRIGSGKTKVLLWSQMHGDEPTATMAIFDLLNFFEQNDQFNALRQSILDNLTLYFIPMLNPDGAERFRRQNALGVDLNRDALRLQNPEGRILKRAQQELKPDWGFNLHDQSRYYAVGKTNKPASISFLAPAFNYEKAVDGKRADAMKLIVEMNQILQQYIPGQVAKYSDAFEPRAFGDNIQKWGTRTILIESGGQYNDPEKQYLRKMNFLALLGAFESIAKQTYEQNRLRDYEDIPFNMRSLYDLILRKATVSYRGRKYKMDLAFNREEKTGDEGVYYEGKLVYIGDLSTSFAYEEFDAEGYEVRLGREHPLTFETILDATQNSFQEYYQDGYTILKVLKLPPPEHLAAYPIQFVPSTETILPQIALWTNPSFFLERNGRKEYLVVNGILSKL
ncbi:MAG: M14 metallopeptidase family protein, partial [Bacteroidota bacterium]